MGEGLNYRMLQGQYALHYGATQRGAPFDVVALAIDSDLGVLLRYGSAAAVDVWAREHRARLAEENPKEARALVVVSGRVPVAQVNRCVAEPTYAAQFLELLANGQLAEEP